MSEQAKFNLRVVGRKQLISRSSNKRSANFATKLSANGNVLQIRIDGGESPSCRGCSLERGVHARLGVGEQRQRINVIRLELGEMPVFEHQARHLIYLR